MDSNWISEELIKLSKSIRRSYIMNAITFYVTIIGVIMCLFAAALAIMDHGIPYTLFSFMCLAASIRYSIKRFGGPRKYLIVSNVFFRNYIYIFGSFLLPDRKLAIQNWISESGMDDRVYYSKDFMSHVFFQKKKDYLLFKLKWAGNE